MSSSVQVCFKRQPETRLPIICGRLYGTTLDARHQTDISPKSEVKNLISDPELQPSDYGIWTSDFPSLQAGEWATMMLALMLSESMMGEMTETILGLIVMAAILVASAWLTNWFARTMYNRCAGCGALNARRRTHCRSCGQTVGR
jgi:hypothetical protein